MDRGKMFANLPSFTIDDIPLGERRQIWQKWKRGFEICLRAAKVNDVSEKKDLLLAQAGFELQEIFYNIPGADVEENQEQDVNPYAVAIEKLDNYFAPLRHDVHERYMFWAMKPENEENLGKFVMRAQVLAAKCNFGNSKTESAGIAVIDKTLQFAPAQLRKKLLLEKELTLEEVIKQVNAYETTRSASEHISSQAILQENRSTVSVQRIQMQCKFCGRYHGSDKPCPAVNKVCASCGQIGHFRAVCFSQRSSANASTASSTANVSLKRKWDQFSTNRNSSNSVRRYNDYHRTNKHRKTTQKLHAIDGTDRNEKDVELLQKVVTKLDSEYLICAEIGGILIDMQIDSGVMSNIIDDKSWNVMVQNGVSIVGKVRPTDRDFKAYAQKTCLNVSGMFDAEIIIRDGGSELKTIARFYIVKDGPQSLLGRNTATRLGVLVVGLPSQHEIVQQMEDVKPFPCIKGVKISLPIDETVKPVAQRFRRLPYATLERVDEKLNDLLSRDIIEKVSEPSPWVSPIVIAIKDNGDIRLCIDMRQVNKAILRETHPLPTIEDIRWKLNGAQYFSRLDIKDAFHQLELDEQSRSLTTFITHKGLFRYKRLLFGISCAPEMFQKVIEQILADCKNVINFIDDIIVSGKDETEHDEALQSVLDKFREYGILLNKDKCAFKLAEIEFLGHRFSKQGMTPTQSKVSAIKSFRTPATSEEVRSFLGLINYVGAFIPNLATISFPLRELTKNHATFKWGPDEQTAFVQLIESISNVSSLSHFNPMLKTRVVADASPVGLGAVLLQFKDEQPRVISYASKSLTDTEKRYAQTEKEALALVWAVERFQVYLFGIRFELETDHKPLETIFSPDSKPCLRIERWVLRLQAFSFDVVYRKGKNNIADSLSRLSTPPEIELFDPDSEVYIRNVAELTAVDLGELEAASTTDPVMIELRDFLDRGVWNPAVKSTMPYHPFRNELGKIGELVVRGSRIIIPQALRERIVHLAHEGHPGRTKMQQRLRSTCWWPGMDEMVRRVVDSCEGCRLVSQPDRPEPMKRRKLPEAPWMDLAIDFLGPLPSGDYLLVIIDYFSRYKEVEVLRKITASETVDRLDRIFTRHGYPRTITLDNGRQFVSSEFGNYCLTKGIHLNNTTPYWPQENGLVERQNRSLVKRLKISQALKRDWKRDLNTYLQMYYSTPHSTTGKPPAELMYNRNIRTKMPSLGDLGTEVSYTDFADHDQHNKEKGREAEDSRRKAVPSSIAVGDKVLMKNVLNGNKLTPTFGTTAMTVTEKQGSKITLLNTDTGKTYDRNSSHLKRIPVDEPISLGDSNSDDMEGSRRFVLDPSKEQRDSNEAGQKANNLTDQGLLDGRADHQGRPHRAIRKPKRFDD